MPEQLVDSAAAFSSARGRFMKLMGFERLLVALQHREPDMRVSPGYCDWALEGQGVIFEALDARPIGITLSSSFVMTPLKSLSSVAVVARRVPVLASCAFCGKENCEWRRLPDAQVEEGPAGETV